MKIKRLISYTLIIILCFNLSFISKATNDRENSNYERINNYIQNNYDNLLLLGKNYCYMTMAEDFKNNSNAIKSTEMIDALIGVSTIPDESKYVKVLTNIIATYDLENATDISEQNNMDNLKNIKDYTMDIIDIGVNDISVSSGLTSTIGQFETELTTAIDCISVLADNTNNWINALSDLEAILKNYSQYEEFLKVIEKRATGNLKKAAGILRSNFSKAMEIKLNTYLDISNENFNNYSEFFFTDIFFKAVKETSEYKSDGSMKFFIDCGDEVVSNIGVLKSSFELGKNIGKLVGNIVVGGEDLLNRISEIMSIYDISNILQEELTETRTEFLNSYRDNNVDKSIVERYFTISEYLINCRIRGEYCVYSIVANDAKLLSWFNKKSATEAKEWYDRKSRLIMDIKDNLLEFKAINNINIMPSEGEYRYSDGTFSYSISFFDINENSSGVYIGMWRDLYKASKEDFSFTYLLDNEEYLELGMRSGKQYNISILPKDEETVHVSVSGEYMNVDGDFILSNVKSVEEVKERLESIYPEGKVDIERPTDDAYNFSVSYPSGGGSESYMKISYIIKYITETDEVYEYNLYEDEPLIYDLETGK